MNILVVEDNPHNIAAAKAQLVGHELTIVSGFDQALELLEQTHMQYQVVLTDVMIPKGGDRSMSEEGRAVAIAQGLMPYGHIIALLALQRGVKRVGILTQGNHHDEPFVFACEKLFDFACGDCKVVNGTRRDLDWDIVHNQVVAEPKNADEYKEYDDLIDRGQIIRIKNWGALLQRLLD